ncbi:hypothetical protein PJ267_18725 [Arthrobacter sp. OVS8]|nr:hypothetical protein PJ267_18725 [Arthrobacter sp. OVS8]
MSAITAAARDSSVIARRNLINVLRTPGRWSPESCSPSCSCCCWASSSAAPSVATSTAAT